MENENQRGVIAETYFQLQGLHKLEATVNTYPLPNASSESILRSVFQATEIALHNLVDLTTRAIENLEQGQTGSASVKLSWAQGFHVVLNSLGLLPQKIRFISPPSKADNRLHVQDSPAYREYMEVLRRFDQAVLKQVKECKIPIETILADESIDSATFNLLHLSQLCNHETKLWEYKLTNVCSPNEIPCYETFIVADGIRDAVYDTSLNGDTFFTQFRGLHQIPEILGREINDYLGAGIRELKNGQFQQAIERLICVNALTEGILVCLPVIIRNLSTSDYHSIRENLGQTSGSHSITLRYRLFEDLYDQLCEEITTQTTKHLNIYPKTKLEEAASIISHNRFDDTRAWFLHLLIGESLKLRSFIDQWRGLHLHLPRNNLGGNATKSLTGSPDAIRMTENMQELARERDPMKPIAYAYKVEPENIDKAAMHLRSYLESPISLDQSILASIGKITQYRFEDVQKRSGFFARKCPFSPPPNHKKQ